MKKMADMTDRILDRGYDMLALLLWPCILILCCILNWLFDIADNFREHK